LTFIVIISSIDLEVVSNLSCIDIEVLLIGFEGNTIFNGRPEHHLRAIHKVVYTVFKLRQIVGDVDSVEQDVMICCDLDSLVAFNKVDKASNLEVVILLPRDFS
jgi:hypothetical protein